MTSFLPGVPVDHVLTRFALAGGNEVASGKLASPESSAALAANALGWFIERPACFPLPLGLDDVGTPLLVEIEYCVRFPWTGGRHPWLDGMVMTKSHLIGIESKRFEPFRDAKTASLSAAYDRPVWGANMSRFGDVRDGLRAAATPYRYLDAAQLVKHAYGLVTEGRRKGLLPVLFYLFAEPSDRRGRSIGPAEHLQHRSEVADFAARVMGDEVLFVATSYREWLGRSSGLALAHAANVIESFSP